MSTNTSTSTNTEEKIRYSCKKCGYANEWKPNKIRQRGKIMALRDGDPRYDVYSLACPRCQHPRRIALLR